MATSFVVPEEGLNGLAALAHLTRDQIETMRAIANSDEISLGINPLVKKIVDEDDVSATTMVKTAISEAIVPLCRLRADMELGAREFVGVITSSLETHAPEKWRKENLASWKSSADDIAPLLESDSAFSISAKASRAFVFQGKGLTRPPACERTKAGYGRQEVGDQGFCTFVHYDSRLFGCWRATIHPPLPG